MDNEIQSGWFREACRSRHKTTKIEQRELHTLTVAKFGVRTMPWKMDCSMLAMSKMSSGYTCPRMGWFNEKDWKGCHREKRPVPPLSVTWPLKPADKIFKPDSMCTLSKIFWGLMYFLHARLFGQKKKENLTYKSLSYGASLDALNCRATSSDVSQ